jgi:hypothetical protein
MNRTLQMCRTGCMMPFIWVVIVELGGAAGLLSCSWILQKVKCVCKLFEKAVKAGSANFCMNYC